MSMHAGLNPLRPGTRTHCHRRGHERRQLPMYLAYSAAGGLSRILQGKVAGGVQAVHFLSFPSLTDRPTDGLDPSPGSVS